jgi:hypothetical protein
MWASHRLDLLLRLVSRQGLASRSKIFALKTEAIALPSTASEERFAPTFVEAAASRRTMILSCFDGVRMFWTGFFIGFAACLAIGLTVHLVRDRRQRAAFVSTLSSAEHAQLRGFETVNGDWRQFRDLLRQSRAQRTGMRTTHDRHRRLAQAFSADGCGRSIE